MNKGRGTRWGILLLGYVLVLCTYFVSLYVCYRSQETAPGEVQGIVWKKFKMANIRPGISSGYYGHGDHYQDFECVVIRFLYRSSNADTGQWLTVHPQTLSNKQYTTGEKIQVIFPHGNPDHATIYSPREFWFNTPYMIIVTVVMLLWSIGFIVVVFKPWQMMDE